jgi:uncharacterized protein
MITTDDRPSLWRRIAGSTLVRLIGGFVALAFIFFIAQLPFMLIARQSARLSAFFDLTYLPGLVAAAAGLLAYYWFVRWTERRRPAELANPLAPFGIGAALAAIMFALTVALLVLFGSVHFVHVALRTAVATALASSLTDAITEELLFRGIIFRLVERSLGTWIAVAISAAIFGALHFGNAHSGLFPLIAIAVEAGIFLAAAYVATRNLWFAIGAHFGWNFTESGIFGLSVSGQGAPPGLIDVNVTGPPLLSGGNFGIEASLVAIAICVAAAVALLVFAARRRNIMPPRWRSKFLRLAAPIS